MSKILFISGVSIDKTPVVKYSIKKIYKLNYDIRVIEFKNSRIKFTLLSLFKVISFRPNIVFFIGLQTLPLLLILQWLPIKKFNWFLESYTKKDNTSFAIRLLKLEKYIRWNTIIGIFPTKERIIPYNKFSFKQILILPNATGLGQIFKPRRISKHEPVKICFYGALDENKVYLREFIKFSKEFPDIHLDLYGNNMMIDVSNEDNINYKGSLPHKELLMVLNQYHFSVIGYKPINFNTKYCAPNKLYEALSLSLPVIVNKNNPTLANFPNINSFGIIADFDNLDKNLYEKLKNHEDYKKLNQNAYKQYVERQNLNNYISELKDLL